jgi:pimeloyl-ACP methyl ester carboxylesterase
MSEAEMLAGKEPFFWESESPEAVLCLHGFTGAPGVFRKLGRVFQNDGLNVFAPVLPGHGTVPEDLIEVTSQQLLDAAEQAYDSLARGYERVHIVGLSMGGALATLLAANHALESAWAAFRSCRPGMGSRKLWHRGWGWIAGRTRPKRMGGMIAIPRRKPQGDELDECFFRLWSGSAESVRPTDHFEQSARKAQPDIEAPVQICSIRKRTPLWMR